jgi:predicted RNA-binding Zn-ribbon protein involved in translation (DUF1610 family)
MPENSSRSETKPCPMCGEDEMVQQRVSGLSVMAGDALPRPARRDSLEWACPSCGWTVPVSN